MKLTTEQQKFIKLWNRSHSVADVAAALGIQPLSASVRASRYRAKGLRLKSFAKAA